MNTMSVLAVCTLAVAQRGSGNSGFGGGDAQTRRETLDADSFSGIFGEITDAVDSIVCSTDTLECSDGSFVSREGDDCSFAECPACDLTDVTCQLAEAQASIFDLFSGGISDDVFEIASPDSLTNLFWDTISWEDVTLPTADTLMSNWLEAVGVDADLSGISTELEELTTNVQDLIDGAADQDAIFEAIQGSESWTTLVDEAGWTPDLDFGMFTTSLENMVNDLQMSSMWSSLPTELTDTVDGLASDLTAFGFNDLESLTDYDSMLETTWQNVQDNSGIDVSDIEGQMNSLIGDFEDYLTGGTDMTLDTIIADIDDAMTAVSAELEENVDNEQLVELYQNLEIVDWGVTTWNQFASETELLTDFTGNLDIVLQSIQFTSEFGDVLTYDWLDNFMTSLNDILRVDGNQYSVCDEEYIKDQVWNLYDAEYDWYTARSEYMTNCYTTNFADTWTNSLASLMSGDLSGAFTPDCSCWEDLWNDQDLVSTMNCVMDAGDSITVEGQIAECNGVIMDTVDEVSLITGALETFEDLANDLTSLETDDWVPNFNVEDLESSLESITSQVSTIGNFDFSTDSFTDWSATVEEWGDDFNSLLSDLTGLEAVTGGDFDLTNLEGAVNAAMTALSMQNPTSQPSTAEAREDDDGSSFPVWAWMVVGGCLLLMCILAFYHCYLKQSLESNLALEGEGMGFDEGMVADLPDEGVENPIRPEVVVNGTNAGTAMGGEID